jgi:hypothetical protein
MRFELPDPTHLSAETVRQRYEEVHLKACERRVKGTLQRAENMKIAQFSGLFTDG